jgi:hypothetical protein
LLLSQKCEDQKVDVYFLLFYDFLVDHRGLVISEAIVNDSTPEPLQGGRDGCEKTVMSDSLMVILYRWVQFNNNEPMLLAAQEVRSIGAIVLELSEHHPGKLFMWDPRQSTPLENIVLARRPLSTVESVSTFNFR